MKKTLIISILAGMWIMPLSIFAQTNNDYEIVPEATSGGAVTEAVENVGAE